MGGPDAAEQTGVSGELTAQFLSLDGRRKRFPLLCMMNVG
jgi:hypothetical protein